MLKVKIIAVGDFLGILLPNEALSRLNAVKGDILHLNESASGYVISACGKDFDEQIIAAQDIMNRYRNALRQLAN